MKNALKQLKVKSIVDNLAWIKIDGYHSKKVLNNNTLLHTSLAWLKR